MPNATVRACNITFEITAWLFVIGITVAEGEESELHP
jgi:hypothetical protein